MRIYLFAAVAATNRARLPGDAVREPDLAGRALGVLVNSSGAQVICCSKTIPERNSA
jgi:hypothetical protein